MSIRIYRILSLIFSILQLPFYILYLGLNLSHFDTDSLLVTISLVVALLIASSEFFVSIKAFKKEDSMLFTLVFEDDGKINKFALIVVIVVSFISLILIALGLYFIFDQNEFIKSLAFLTFGTLLLFNSTMYYSYLLVVKTHRYIRL